MMKRTLLICFLFLSAAISAQDYHLSQYFSTPLLLNPALTANIDGPYRVTGTYRRQWWQNGFPYNTYTAGFETKLLQNKLPEYSRLGVGLAILGDESLGGVYKNNSALLSLSYHQPLDFEGVSSIGGGFQFNYSNRRIDFNQLNYESQFNILTEGFDSNISSGEAFQSGNKKIYDMNAGLVYTYNDGTNSFYVGTSVYNIRRPQLSFFSDSSSRINMRKLIHGGTNLTVSEETGTKFTLSFLAMEQAKSVELNVGAALGFNVRGNYIYLGAFTRVRDAIYPYVSLQTESFQLGLSYDILTSDLKYSMPKRSSIELSFLLVKPDNSEKRRFMPWNY
jgi:type IX secretion system PorP/SprF family membrane protein